MKNLIIAALCLSLTGAAAQEVTPAGSGKRVQKNARSLQEKAKFYSERLGKELGLSDEQKTKWEAAALERMQANEPIKEKLKGSTTPEERRKLHTQAKANHDKFDATVATFLTAEQKAAYEKLKKEQREKQKARMKAAKGAKDAELPPEIIED